MKKTKTYSMKDLLRQRQAKPKNGSNKATIITFLICMTLLSCINLIGIYWGETGLIKTGQTIFLIILSIGAIVVIVARP